MGLYFDPVLGGRIQSKKDWAEAHGREVRAMMQYAPDESPSTHCYVFWQRAPWGENLAVGYSQSETARLFNSKVFSAMYIVPKENLRNAGLKL